MGIVNKQKQNVWPRINEWMNSLIKIARSAVSTNRAQRGFTDYGARCKNLRSASGFSGFVGDFFGCSIFSKRGILVCKNSLASYQQYRHSVESHALSCSFKQSNLSAWSLFSWHPTHIYLQGRLCFIQVVYSPLSRSRRVTQIMLTETPLLSASLESFLPPMNW